jgi:SOS response regulatory protein OraA/RecX
VTGRPRRARGDKPGAVVGSADGEWLAGRDGSASRGRPLGPGGSSHAGSQSGPDPDERDDPESVARLICLRLLTAAPRTQTELATALRRRGVPDDAAEAVLARFAEVKLIDDATFARAWVESRHHSRGLAGRALAAELRRKGVAQDDITGALEELDPDQELETARELVTRRIPATRGQPGPARMRKLTGVLARKGYGPALAYRVAREALEQEAAEIGRASHDLDGLEEPDAVEELDGF